MKGILKNTYVSILIFSILLFVFHWGLDAMFSIVTYYSLSSIYLFHIFSTLVVAGIIQWVHKNFKDHTGFAFMGTSLLKMLAAIVFLLPGFLSEDKPNFTNILNFFIPYFLFLTFEAIQIIKLINQEERKDTL